jgi:hypothetical protein
VNGKSGDVVIVSVQAVFRGMNQFIEKKEA